MGGERKEKGFFPFPAHLIIRTCARGEKYGWLARLIVPVTKRDGSVRICGDYKVTVNQAALPDSYPLPRIDDLFAALSGGRVFSKLDLAHAYQQISLDDESKKLVVINTQKGLFQYNRLPFGVSAAPAIFQRTIEGILRDIPQVCVYIPRRYSSHRYDERRASTTTRHSLTAPRRSGAKAKTRKVFLPARIRRVPRTQHIGKWFRPD